MTTDPTFFFVVNDVDATIWVYTEPFPQGRARQVRDENYWPKIFDSAFQAIAYGRKLGWTLATRDDYGPRPMD